jgi:hypothetical protein
MTETEKSSLPLLRLIGRMGDQAIYTLTDLGRMGIFYFFPCWAFSNVPFVSVN